jgi:hypothetical protein
VPTPASAPTPFVCDTAQIFTVDLKNMACADLENDIEGSGSIDMCWQRCCLLNTLSRRSCVAWQWYIGGEKHYTHRCWLGRARVGRCRSSSGWIGGSNVSIALPTPHTAPTPNPPAPVT